MIDYPRYKECMDDARKLTQDAEKMLVAPGVGLADRKQKVAFLLGKADKLRKLAMQYASAGVH